MSSQALCLLFAPLREAKGLTDQQILNFYSYGSVSSLLCMFIFGYYLTKKGLPFIFVLYGIAIAGQFIYTAGAYFDSYLIMVIGRIVTTAGCESVKLIISFLLKNYVDVKYYILMNCSVILLSRICYACLFYAFPIIYYKTQSFEVVHGLSLLSMLTALLFFTVFYYNVKDLNKSDKKEEKKEEVTFSDLKQLNWKYYALVGISSTTLAAYWVFNFMIMQFLEGRVGLEYLEAKNVLSLTPVVQIAVTFLCMAISFYYVNEPLFMLFTVVLQLGIFIGVPLYEGQGVSLGIVVCVMQGIIGAMFGTNFYSLINKVIPKKINPIAMSLSETFMTISRFGGIWMSGKIIGVKANYETINSAFRMLAFFAATSLVLVLTLFEGIFQKKQVQDI